MEECERTIKLAFNDMLTVVIAQDKVKKNEDRCLLPQTLRARIRPIGFDVQDQYVTVDKFMREHMVTRQFMSETYGGSPQETQPIIGELYKIDHDYDDFFYMNTDFQPEAPEVPGAPGLWFSTEPGYDIGVRRVFTKIKDRTAKNDNKWLYVGQYIICAANPPSLTVEEWRAQPSVVGFIYISRILRVRLMVLSSLVPQQMGACDSYLWLGWQRACSTAWSKNIQARPN